LSFSAPFHRLRSCLSTGRPSQHPSPEQQVVFNSVAIQVPLRGTPSQTN
jgi:hypothetical protein